jgi:hypothetical protein
MRSPGSPSPRRPYRPSLEAVEGRCLPGGLLSQALLAPLTPFPDLTPFADDAALARPVDPSPPEEGRGAAAVARDAAGGTGTLAPAGVLAVPVPGGLGVKAPVAGDEWAFAAFAGAGATGVAAGSVGGTVFSSFCTGVYPKDPPPGWPYFPAAGEWVELGGQRRQTDAAGRYAFTGVPPGEHVVGFFLQGFGEARQTVTVAPGGASQVDVYFPFWVAGSPGVFRVQFRPGVTAEEIDALNKAYGVTVLGASGSTYVLRIPLWTFTDDYIAAYGREPIVQSAGRFPVVFCP